MVVHERHLFWHAGADVCVVHIHMCVPAVSIYVYEQYILIYVYKLKIKSSVYQHKFAFNRNTIDGSQKKCIKMQLIEGFYWTIRLYACNAGIVVVINNIK